MDEAWGADLDGLPIAEARARVPAEALASALAREGPTYQRDVASAGGRGARLAVAGPRPEGASAGQARAVVIVEHRFVAGAFDRVTAAEAARWATLAGPGAARSIRSGGEARSPRRAGRLAGGSRSVGSVARRRAVAPDRRVHRVPAVRAHPRLPRDRRPEPRAPARPGPPGGRPRQRSPRAADRRDRHRQGGLRAHAPRARAPRRPALRRRQLRRHLRQPVRVRALRARARVVHRRRPRARRPPRPRRRRNPRPRRGRRAAPRPPGLAPPRAPGAPLPTGGGRRGARLRRPGGRRHQPRSLSCRRRPRVPRGSLLPAQRRGDPGAAPARAGR